MYHNLEELSKSNFIILGNAKIIAPGIVVRRIRALKNIYFEGKLIAKKGESGGFIQNCVNIDHTSWVTKTGCVLGDCQIKNSIIAGNVKESNIDSSVIGKNAKVENSIVAESKIYGYARINGATIKTSTICDYANVECNVSVSNSLISGKAKIYGKTYIFDSSILNCAEIGGSSIISGCTIKGETGIFESNVCWSEGLIAGSDKLAFANVFDERTLKKALRDTASGAWLEVAYPEPFVEQPY